MTTSPVLKDVVAYVDVWSSDKTANYAKPFVQQLQEMGAQVSKTFNKQVTHVVFKNGHPATWRKAKKSDVRLVSVLWVGRCYEDGVRVDEELYPALNDDSNPVLKNKKPKDSPERTPENDRRMKKKLDKMMKDLHPKQALATEVSPIIIDEENGIVYSPALKRSDYMAQRLKAMKEKRENLSPTASQMVESCSPTGMKPSLGSTPTVFKLKYDQSDDDSSASAAEPGYSPDKEEGRTKVDLTNLNRHDQLHRKASEKPWLSPCRDVPQRILSPVKCTEFKDKEDDVGNSKKKSRRTSVRKKPAETHSSVGLTESPRQDKKSDIYKNIHTEKRESLTKTPSPSPKKSEKGKGKLKAVKSLKETKARPVSDTVNSLSCLSSPAVLPDAARKKSKEPSPPVQKVPKRPRHSFSALVRSFTASSDSKSVASCSTDGDDHVFEDCFSPANRQRAKTSVLFSLPAVKEFELDSVPHKRKQRRSESMGSEANSKKKRKLEEGQSGKNRRQPSDASSEPQIHPQQDVKGSLPASDSSVANVRPVDKRQSTLTFTSTSAAVKKRRASISVQPTSQSESNAESNPQKHSAASVPSCSSENDQSDDDSSASAAEPGYSPDKEEGRTKVDLTNLNRHDQRHRKASEKPWLSPCRDVPQRIPSPVKCTEFKDKEDNVGNSKKKSRRTSVRKKPAETHSSVGLTESPRQDKKSDIYKNIHTEKRESLTKMPSPSPKKSEKGKGKLKAVKSLKETKARPVSDTVNSLSCLSSPAVLPDAARKKSKEPSPPVQKVPKRPRHSFSALVRSFTASSDSKSVASCSTDGDDHVFEDCFSPANRQRAKTSVLFSLPAVKDPFVQVPFELDSVPHKRKQRRSESMGSEANSIKKRKLEEGQSGKNRRQPSDASSEPQIHPQQDVKGSLPASDSSVANVRPVDKRQSTLTFTSTSAAVKKRRASISVQPTSQTESNAESNPQKHSAASVPSCSSESRGNAAALTEVPSEGEENPSKQIGLSVQKMVNRTTALRTMVMTSMPTDKQQTVCQVVKSLGGFLVVDRVCESTTHVVSGGHRRTLNILLGIARGCWILSFEWILWCLEQRQWIPEEPYELSDQFPAAQICRLQRHLSAGEHQQDLFHDQPAMFVSQHSQPPTQSLVELIELCGGRVCKTVRQAGICIGKYSGRRPEGSRILSEQWVLDSITHLKQLSYDNYDLE